MTNAIAEFSKKIDEKLVDPLRQVLKGRTLVCDPRRVSRSQT